MLGSWRFESGSRFGDGLEETGGAEPGGAGIGPGRAGAVGAADAEVVSGFGIDVEFGGDAGATEREVHKHAVLGRTDQIGATVNEEDGRGFGMDDNAGGEFVFIFGFEVTRIDQDRKVRPATDVIDVVDVLIGARLETRSGAYGQVASGGKTNDADAMRIDSEFA